MPLKGKMTFIFIVNFYETKAKMFGTIISVAAARRGGGMLLFFFAGSRGNWSLFVAGTKQK